MKWKTACGGVLIAAMLAGCNSTKFQGPSYYGSTTSSPDASARISKIGVLYDTEVQYRSSIFRHPDGDKTVAANTTQQAKTNIEAGMQQQLGKNGYTLVNLPQDDDARELLKQLSQARGNFFQPFESLRGDATKSPALGLAAGLVKKNNVDALAIVTARQSKLSTGATIESDIIRVPVFAVDIILSPILIPVAYFTASYEYCPECPLEFTLFDRGGKIIFYDRKGTNISPKDKVPVYFGYQGIDIIDAGKVSDAIGEISTDLAQASKPPHADKTAQTN